MLLPWLALALVACGSSDPEAAPSGSSADAGHDATSDADEDAAADASTDGAPIDDGSSIFRSGTRLRARTLDGGGGAKIFVGWHDTKLDVDCQFRAQGDGSLRCVPYGVAVIFTDSTCTTPIAVANSATCGTAPPKYAVSYEATTICGSSHAKVTMFEIGAPLASPPASAWTRLGDGSCSVASVPTRTMWTTTKLDPSVFVGAKLVDEPHGKLLVRVMVGDDGAREALELADAATKVTCTPAQSAPIPSPGPAACLPAPFAYFDAASGPYADASCTKPAARAACASPGVVQVLTRTDDACKPYALSYRAIGAKLAGGWSNPSGTCTALGSTGDVTYYEQGAPIDLATFPSVAYANVGTGPLRAFEIQIDGRTVMGASQQFSLSSGQSCSVATAPDGKSYCVDGRGAFFPETTTYYADASCKNRIARVYGDPACTPELPKYVAEYGGDPVCALVVEKAFAVAAPYTGSVYAKSSSGPCTPDTPSAVERFVTLGSEVPLATAFPTVVAATE